MNATNIIIQMKVKMNLTAGGAVATQYSFKAAMEWRTGVT